MEYPSFSITVPFWIIHESVLHHGVIAVIGKNKNPCILQFAQ